MSGTSTTPVSPALKPNTDEFARREYEESVTAYFKGVDIGLGYMRLFLFLNGFLFTFFVALWREQRSESPLDMFYVLILLICGAGVCVSVLLSTLVKFYDRQLQNCIDRAIEIESFYGGDLCNRINVTAHRRFDSINGLHILIFVIGFTWVIALILSAKTLYPY